MHYKLTSDIPNNLRTEVRKLHNKLGQKEFFNKLIKIDPLAKKFILPTDSQRSIRAYEVKKFTKKSLYDWIKNTKPDFDTNLFICDLIFFKPSFPSNAEL